LNVLLLCAECPLNCQSCTVTSNSDTVATCTQCNSYHRLIDATIGSSDVAGNCYCTCSLIVDVCVLTLYVLILRPDSVHSDFGAL